MDDYREYFPPEDGTTKVYSTISNPEVRKVGAKTKTISLDFTLKMQWLDPRIKTNLKHEKDKNGEITLGPKSIEVIWSPDLRILNRQSFKAKHQWASLITTRILTGTDASLLDRANNNTFANSVPIIEMKYDVKSTVYCKGWDYSKYPVDSQTCNVTFGSGSLEATFVSYGFDKSLKIPVKSKSSAFEIGIHSFDNMKRDGSNTIGFEIKIGRIISPYLLKYYVPCMGIVLLSAMSFAIPVTAIPGRVGLLVTLFLTLTNLFIHHMVR